MKSKFYLCFCLSLTFIAPTYANEEITRLVKGLSLSMAAFNDQPGGLPYEQIPEVLAKVKESINASSLNIKSKECLKNEFNDLRLMNYGSTYFNNINTLIHNATMGKKTIKNYAFKNVSDMNIDFEIDGSFDDLINMKAQLEKALEEYIEPVARKCNL